MMRLLPPTRVATLVLLGALAAAWADDNQRDDHRNRDKQHESRRPPREQKPPAEHDRRPPPRPQPQPRREPSPHPRAGHPHRSWKEAHAWQQHRGWERSDGWHGRGSWHDDRATHWSVEHRTWSQRGGYGGYYIPHQRFHLYFGRDHWFRIHTRPVIYLGYPRFEYQGFSFVLVDPWPEDWSDDWYADDDVYIDYSGDGYYLYNRSHPGVAIAVTVVK